MAAATSGDAGCPSRASSGSAASTSTHASDAASHDQASFSQGLEDALRSHLASWAMRLVQLQPKVSCRPHLPRPTCPTLCQALRLAGALGREFTWQRLGRRPCSVLPPAPPAPDQPASSTRQPLLPLFLPSPPPAPPQVHVSEHLLECGLYLFKYLRQLQVQACLEGKFPFQVRLHWRCRPLPPCLTSRRPLASAAQPCHFQPSLPFPPRSTCPTSSC